MHTAPIELALLVAEHAKDLRVSTALLEAAERVLREDRARERLRGPEQPTPAPAPAGAVTCRGCGLAPVRCDYCGAECVDFSQVQQRMRMCVLCLSTRLDEDRETLDGITEACVAGGYDIDGDACEATWLAEQLVELKRLRALHDGAGG